MDKSWWNWDIYRSNWCECLHFMSIGRGSEFNCSSNWQLIVETLINIVKNIDLQSESQSKWKSLNWMY